MAVFRVFTGSSLAGASWRSVLGINLRLCLNTGAVGRPAGAAADVYGTFVQAAHARWFWAGPEARTC